MVDTASLISIIPLGVLETTRVSRGRIVKKPIRISSFEGTSSFTLGHINLELTVKPMRTMNKFHVIGGGCLSYDVLLGGPRFIDIKPSIHLPTVRKGFLKVEEDPHLPHRFPLPTR